MITMRRAVAMAAAIPLAVSAADTDVPNWPQWRGPEQNAVAADRGAYPVAFDSERGVLWKTALPGKGCSTPIVWERRIYLTAPADGEDAVLAFDWSGKELWRTKLGAGLPGKNKAASGCNPSIVTDGRLLFAYFKTGTLAALDLDGKLRWRTNLMERFGPDHMVWDIGTSPVLTSNDVVVAVMNAAGSCNVAFEKGTGRLHWKVDRNFPCPFECDQGYTTPLLLPFDGREAFLVWSADHVTIHDAADGKMLWDCGGFNPDQKSNWPPVASPVRIGDLLIVPNGRGTLLHGIRLAGRGEVTSTARLWMRRDSGSYTPTPVEQGGRVYLLRDRERIGVECFEPLTGKQFWFCDLPKSSAAFYSSPVIAGGHLYAARSDGIVFVLRLGKDAAEVVAQNAMGEPIYATPVPLAGRILLRGDRTLYCLGAK